MVESVTTTEELYGGDIIEITEILDNSVETLEKDIEDLEQPAREAKVKEVTEVNLLNLSNLHNSTIQSEEIIFILRKWQHESLSEHNDCS